MNDEFVNNALAQGKKGELWLKKLPEIVKKYEKKWSLQALPPYTLSYSYAAPVVRKDGTKAVIKIGMQNDLEFLNQIDALTVFNGEGIIRLIDFDKNDAVILTEIVEPGIPLSAIDDENKTTKILAATMKKIWKPLPKNHQFITIHEWSQAVREYPGNDGTSVIPLDIIQEAKNLFLYLLETSDRLVLTHADLHHDNVLFSKTGKWIAIDPKGIAAEPAYDTAALIRNPYKKLRNMNNLDDLLKKRILILSKELSFDPKRIHQWCLAQSILSGVWTSDNEEYTAYALKIISALKRINF